ncbi:MAG: Asp23/Gls24 family envelope stress response protein [Eubacteriales bacterium]|nr:Asp23/Gls24 family envelope stress response protein [Eubacteriales bacterium]
MKEKSKKNVFVTSSPCGETSISVEAVKQMAGNVAMECFGIVGMASVNMSDGIVKLLRGESAQKGVEIEIEEDGIGVTFHIITAYGVSIVAVTENLIENVKYKLEAFTGLKVKNVDIYVEGVKPVD